MNSGERNYEDAWMVYYAMVKTVGGIFMKDSSVVSPLPLLLLGGGEEGKDKGEGTVL